METHEAYSYELGEKMGKLLWKNMGNVDCGGHFRESPHFIQLNADEINEYSTLRKRYEENDLPENWNKILSFYKSLDYLIIE